MKTINLKEESPSVAQLLAMARKKPEPMRAGRRLQRFVMRRYDRGAILPVRFQVLGFKPSFPQLLLV